MNGPLAEQSVQFAVDIVRYCRWMTDKEKEFVLSKQILRSGTSVGANIHEANFAVSRAEFIVKMQIALKEAHETQYWLLVLKRTDYLPEEYRMLEKCCESLIKMLVATLNTVKAESSERK